MILGVALHINLEMKITFRFCWTHEYIYSCCCVPAASR